MKRRFCLFFDVHLEKEDWATADDYISILEQVDAMKEGYTPKVCKCMRTIQDL